jgi:hypothetical protein
LATTSTARRETRVVKIIVIDEGKKVLGGWSRERCREIQKTGQVVVEEERALSRTVITLP